MFNKYQKQVEEYESWKRKRSVDEFTALNEVENLKN